MVGEREAKSAGGPHACGGQAFSHLGLGGHASGVGGGDKGGQGIYDGPTHARSHPVSKTTRLSEQQFLAGGWGGGAAPRPKLCGFQMSRRSPCSKVARKTVRLTNVVSGPVVPF